MLPDVNQEDLQLRQDNTIVETDDNDQEEIPEDVNKCEDIDNEHFVMEKGLDTAKPTWESTVYPTPDLSVVSNFLADTDICLPIKSEGVRAVTSFAMSTDETFTDPSDFPDIEPAVIHELKHQQEDRFFDFRQY